MRVYTACPTCAEVASFIARGGLRISTIDDRPVCPNGHAFSYRHNEANIPLPACCGHLPTDPVAKKLYAAYNRGGDLATAGLNYRGEPCPTWEELPENVRAKWEAVAAIIA